MKFDMKVAWRLVVEHFRRMTLAYLVFVFSLCLTWAWGDYFARILEEGTKFFPFHLEGVGVALSFVLFGVIWIQIKARTTAERLTEDLRRSRERDRLVEMATHDVIRDWDLPSDYLKWNEAIQSMFGFSAAEVKPHIDWWKDRLHPEDRGRVLAGLQMILDGRSEFWTDEYRFCRGNGNYANVIDRGYIVRDLQERPVRMIASMMDITPRKRMEEALADGKERLAVTLRSIADGVITTDVAGNVDLINKVAEHLTGWSQAEAHGKPLTEVLEIIDPTTRAPGPNPIDKAIQTGRGIDLAENAVLVSRDRTERIIAVSGALIRDTSGNNKGVVLVFRDVTKKYREAEELLNASKLESLAILANGIAHDLGNIVTAIIGNLSLTKMYANPSDRAFQKLDEAQKAALRAKVLIQQLSTFAKGGALTKSESLLTDLIRDSVTSTLLGSPLSCKFTLPEDLWSVEVDAAQFTNVLNNLVHRALQAMPGGGILQVRAENFVLGPESNLTLPEGRFVRVTFADQGSGIRPEHVKKVFDPYFVNEDKRSGLGLATAYSIIKKHGGTMTVESALGVGTTFYIYLPALAEEIVPPPEVPPPESGPETPVGEGRILVVDDEESIRMVASQLLNELGYEVELASNGETAIEMYQQAKSSKRPFDLVILDLAMGRGMGGKDTMAKLKAGDPEIKAVISTGYGNDPVVVNCQDYGFSGAIVKPYRMEDLATVVYEIIGHTKF